MPPFNHFDFLAPVYDRLIRPPDDDHLADMLGMPIHGRLLDAGGGTGRIAQGLIGGAGSVVVADTSLEMLRQAQTKGDLQVIACQTERLPFPDRCFERIIVIDAFHHLEDQEHSLAELWRTLSVGGRLVIEEPDIRRFVVKLVALAEKLTLFRSRFESGEHIATQLGRHGARTSIYRDGYAVWVVAEKVS